MTTVFIIGLIIWIYTIVMIVNFKKHPRLTLSTILIMTITLLGIVPSGTWLYWIVLWIATAINGRRQKRLAA